MMTQAFLRTKALLALSLFVLALTSCEKDDTGPGATSNTITDVVVRTDDFSTLESAVLKGNVQTTLSGAGPFTVFAPDNAAFAASNVTTAVLNSLSADQVRSILLYHTLPNSVPSGSVPAGPNAKVITASGDSVFVTRNSSGVFVNGVQVTQADITASNGVIHRIGRVLMPPVGNIVQTVSAPGNGLDSLAKAVTRAATAAGGDPMLATALTNTTLTVFAPSNAAFTQLLGALNLTDINQIPVNTLLAVLRYHVVPGRAFSSDLANGNLTMLAGGNTTVNLTNGTNGGPTLTGTGNGTNRANITIANVVARNGVVHVIDRVLLP